MGTLPLYPNSQIKTDCMRREILAPLPASVAARGMASVGGGGKAAVRQTQIQDADTRASNSRAVNISRQRSSDGEASGATLSSDVVGGDVPVGYVLSIADVGDDWEGAYVTLPLLPLTGLPERKKHNSPPFDSGHEREALRSCRAGRRRGR
ncbi:hypothetical protein E2C01_020035 [Portunus trituberculatus]|uniref:Uncharacterized protein n=1 Tax=Portunus trituberculatus TaxID=210409 RepID=A0A5B7E223_PORTR|nr:hypothetical protein [Portunus trituberculatus]